MLKTIKRFLLSTFFILIALFSAAQSERDIEAIQKIERILADEDNIFELAEITVDGKFMVMSLQSYNYIFVYSFDEKRISHVIDFGYGKSFIDKGFFKINPIRNEIIVHLSKNKYSTFERWDIETGQKLSSFEVTGYIHSYNISNNSDMLVVSFESPANMIQVRDYYTGKIYYQAYGSNQTINFSPNNQYIALYASENYMLGGEKHLVVWDYQVDTFSEGWQTAFPGAYFSADGQHLKAGSLSNSEEYSETYFQTYSIKKDKWSRKFVYPHNFYDKNKKACFIQNIKTHKYSVSCAKSKYKFKAKDIHELYDGYKYSLSSFDYGAFDFNIEANQIVFPIFDLDTTNSYVLCFHSLEKSKTIEFIPFDFKEAKYIKSERNDKASLVTQLEISFYKTYYNYLNTKEQERLNDYYRTLYHKQFSEIIQQYESLSLPFDTFNLLIAYSELSDLAEFSGDYKLTDELNNKKQRIAEKHYAHNFPIQRDLNYNLAYSYYRLNNYDKAEYYITKLQNLNIQHKCLNTHEHALSYILLALIYNNLDDKSVSATDSLLDIALESFINQGYEDSYWCHQVYQLKGELCRMEIDPENGLEENRRLFRQAYKYYSKANYSEQSPDNASLLNSKGLLYLLSPQAYIPKDSIKYYLNKASDAFLDGYVIYDMNFGQSHSDYMQGLYNEALSNFIRGKLFEDDVLLDLSSENFAISVQSRINFLYQNISFMSEEDATLFVDEEMNSLNDGFLSLATSFDNDYLKGVVYDYALKTKSLLLKSSSAMRTSIVNSNDTTLIHLYNNWLQLKREISSLTSTPYDAKERKLELLEAEANGVEAELMKRSQTLSDIQNIKKSSWQAVRDSLKEGEAAIEFLKFNRFNPSIPGYTDTIVYCASLLKHDSKHPELIVLFYEHELESILGKNATNNLDYIRNVYGTKSEINCDLYNLIWLKLEKHLTEVKKVYVSPIGLLYKVSFAALLKPNNEYLSDRYEFSNISSSYNIILKSSTKIDIEKSSFLLFGGIEYSEVNIETEVWDYLKGTKEEVDSIANLLNNQSLHTNMYQALEASELKFIEKASESNVIHLSTHGFFFSDPTKVDVSYDTHQSDNEIVFRGSNGSIGNNYLLTNSNPLIRSGIALAGANKVWNQEQTDPIEDGVLTAQEILGVDMNNTNLAVLSACETGIGEVKGAEGVYGLQRAFKMAGVDYIIMSLWQVPDKETKEFMTLFYENLISLGDIEEAFSETQLVMRKKYDPYYWAAFVLIE